MQPGQVFTPRGSDEPPKPNGVPNPDRGPTGPPVPIPSPTPPPEPVSPPVAMQVPVAAAQPPVAAPAAASPPANRQFQPATGNAPAPRPLDEAITWTASEFIDHEKSLGWYLVLIAGSLVITALVYLITRDVLSTVIVALVAIIFASFAGHKPRTQQYGLSLQGLQIGIKTYGYQDFKTFSVIEEGAIASIVFMPLKRFMPPLTIYVAPDMEEQVVTYLSAFLPFEQRRADMVDSLMRRIRF